MKMLLTVLLALVAADVATAATSSDWPPACLQNPRPECCSETTGWGSCAVAAISGSPPLKCYFTKGNESDVENVDYSRACAKPDDLNATLTMKEGIPFINITWKFPNDSTLMRVKGFLLKATFLQNNQQRSILRKFNVTGHEALNNESLAKVSESLFIYDCIVAMSNTTYSISIKSIPSVAGGGTSKESLGTGDFPQNKNANENCTSEWRSMMYEKLTKREVQVCFYSAPASFNISKYNLNVVTRKDYDNREWMRGEHQSIDAEKKPLGGLECRNFTRGKPGNYMALLQPNARCFCAEAEKTCGHTYLQFTLPEETDTDADPTTPTEKQSTAPTTKSMTSEAMPSFVIVVVIVLVALVVVVSVVVVVAYCFFSDLKDFIARLFGKMFASDMCILVVFQPSNQPQIRKTAKKFIHQLKWKCRAKVDTLPKFDGNRGGCRGRPRILRRGSDVSVASEMPDCNCGDKRRCRSPDDQDALMTRLNKYNLVVVLHTDDSTTRLKTFEDTLDFPSPGCNAFLSVMRVYLSRSCLSAEQPPSDTSSTIEAGSLSDDGKPEAERKPEVTRREVRSKVDSGYYSGIGEEPSGNDEEIETGKGNAEELETETGRNTDHLNDTNDDLKRAGAEDLGDLSIPTGLNPAPPINEDLAFAGHAPADDNLSIVFLPSLIHVFIDDSRQSREQIVNTFSNQCVFDLDRDFVSIIHSIKHGMPHIICPSLA